MAKRKIIKIDEELCNGCGECVIACAEGALQIIDGKARLVKEQYCDGLGDCIGECPTGALTIVEADVEAFDQEAVRRHLMQTQGIEAVNRMEEAAEQHTKKSEKASPAPFSGCPGTMARMMETAKAAQPSSGFQEGHAIASDLQHWPVQLHLVRPGAPFFVGKELLVLSTCAPVASADIHWRFIRGRSVVVACPKLDDTEGYVEKLAGILQESTISKVIITRMEVPCCGGLTAIVKEAVKLSGRKDLKVEETTVSLSGDVISAKEIASIA